MNRNIYLVIIAILLVMPSVIAQPPFVQTGGEVFSEGLEIRFPPVRVTQIGRNVTAHFHVYNLSNGFPITNTSASCYFNLYNLTGDHLIDQQLTTFHGLFDFEIFIDGGNFTENGVMAAVIQCNTSTTGGFDSFGIIVNKAGEELTEAVAILFGFIFFIPLIMCFLFMLLSIKTNKNQFHLQVFYFLLGLLFPLFSLQFGSSVVEGYIIFSDLKIIFDVFYYSYVIMFFFIFALTIFYIAKNLIAAANKKKTDQEEGTYNDDNPR